MYLTSKHYIMKNYYLIYTFFFATIFCSAQSYEFGIIHISDYDFKVIAIPDFDSAGDTDISDVGFSLILPTGSVDVTNPVGLLTARTWTVQEFDAAFLDGLDLGDGSQDVFQFNLPPGQSLLSHTSGQQIELVSFTITNSPVTGEMSFLLNNDPIATGAGGVLDSFYNSNIDATTTQDYFSAPASGFDSFMFSTLSVDDFTLDDSTIQIYPNPASDYINISTTSTIQSVEMFDVLGKKVKYLKNSNKVDARSLQSGIYIVKIYTDKGNIAKKILVE